MPSASAYVLILSTSLAVACAASAGASASTRTAAGSSAPAPHAAMSPRERGEHARRFVRKWGAHVQRAHDVPVDVWARRMVPNFVAVEASALRRALGRDSFEAAMAELAGPTRPQDTVGRAAPRARAARSAKLLGDSARDLTYTPVQPCRILDTRVAGGAIPANGIRGFVATFNSGSGSFGPQGGSSTDCGMSLSGATAVAINLTAVAPAAAGYATVYPAGAAQPVAASVNYAAGAIVNNTVIVGIPSPQQSTDFNVFSFAQSHYVADIVGYFAPPQASPLDCVLRGSNLGATISAGATGSASGLACDAGYNQVGMECQSFASGVHLIESSSSQCRWLNSTGSLQGVVAYTVCCRTTGR